ncbi:DUF3159 domain-containing protein [Amycolatopsis acidiphila]|uniref:DUF3159 domain-containing protein n=1 Tax=Amycolatopsis acidiphila TaxID=715473 RepID=A0A558A2S1_9PSEU|nr:DUF3159 domain-containing protein [Amycolatopsis acidiphila]TVT18550.1 DUF3159 domain-containing protein [Amycolatopsis acidiphila]UIJ59371.1 DUF3159 domain-containing protein [Amycolatopsis acidiphila]
MTSPAARERESLASVLGGRKGAVDASLPPLAFVLGWLIAGNSIAWGSVAATATAVAVGVFRLVRGDKARAVVVSLAAVIVAALVALHTGRAQDFFLIQLLSNVASALLWAASVVVRWPLLGVVVGLVLGQKTRWRRDPALLRAYSRASLTWSCQYLLRVAVYLPLWWTGQLVALGVARTVLTWPLQALTIAVSGWVLYRTLPADHPGLRLEPAGERESAPGPDGALAEGLDRGEPGGA